MPDIRLTTDGGTISIIRMLVDAGMVKSNSEARRLIEQGGVSIDGQRVSDAAANIALKTPVVLKAGKRQFARISGS